MNKYWLLEEFHLMRYEDFEEAFNSLLESDAELLGQRLSDFWRIEYTLEDMDHVIFGGWRGQEELDSRRETALERVTWVQSEAKRFCENYWI